MPLRPDPVSAAGVGDPAAAGRAVTVGSDALVAVVAARLH